MARLQKRTEYVLEPKDAEGDILDPQFYETLDGAYEDVTATFDALPDAVTIDLARLVRWGNEDDGETKREYDYRHRFHRDGQREDLATLNGLEPVVWGLDRTKPTLDSTD